MHRVYLHPLPVRLWHWINAAACVILFLSAVQIRYVGLVDAISFRDAVRVHNVTGFVLIGNYFLWLGYYLCSDRITNYHAEASPVQYFLGSLRQALFYGYGIFVGQPNPFKPTVHRKFNPLQAMTYQLLMLVLLPIQAITGILLYDLTRFSGAVAMLGGVRAVDTAHVLVFIFFAFYLPAHVYLGTLGHRSVTHFKEMITGYEEEEPDATETTGS
jgi:thiosulfate reductase cytochrome b subunit